MGCGNGVLLMGIRCTVVADWDQCEWFWGVVEMIGRNMKIENRRITEKNETKKMSKESELIFAWLALIDDVKNIILNI